MTYVNVSGGHFELEDTIKCYTMYCAFIYSGEVYSIQHYVIEFVSDLRQVSGFLLYLSFLHQ